MVDHPNYPLTSARRAQLEADIAAIYPTARDQTIMARSIMMAVDERSLLMLDSLIDWSRQSHAHVPKFDPSKRHEALRSIEKILTEIKGEMWPPS